jgi:hypothetical protein
MTKYEIDPIMLGHNPFFGVDHLSREAGNAKAARFEDSHQLAEMLLYCHELGVRGMMMSTHPRSIVVSELIGRESQLASTWRVYPLIPYVQKYVRGANEKGLVNLVSDILSQASVSQKLSLLLQGGRGLVTRDIQDGLTMLIDVELLAFKGRPLGAVFLHDALTDLALGLGVDSVLEIFRDYVQGKYRVPAGFVTKNLPLLRERLERRGWKDLLAMASFNAIGFWVNPSLEECAAAIRKPGMTFVAMSTLAGGALSPEVAYQYLARFPTIDSIVVGMSRKTHAVETVTMINRYLPFANQARAQSSAIDQG